MSDIVTVNVTLQDTSNETHWFVVYRSWGFGRGNPDYCLVHSDDGQFRWSRDLPKPIFKVKIPRAFWHLQLDELAELYKQGKLRREHYKVKAGREITDESRGIT
jgi:hypothetical protein